MELARRTPSNSLEVAGAVHGEGSAYNDVRQWIHPTKVSIVGRFGNIRAKISDDRKEQEKFFSTDFH